MELGGSTNARTSKLEPKDCIISVIIDEIYTSKQVQYMHGKLYDSDSETVTKTLLCVMIRSVAGKYRDAMLPCSNLEGKKQYDIWKNILPILCEIGFNPIITMADGNAMLITDSSKSLGKNNETLDP